MPKAKAAAAKKAAPPPWWLEEGEELCSHCGQLYILELEFRCTDCDGPSCPHCKVKHAAGHFVCTECAKEDTPKEDSHG